VSHGGAISEIMRIIREEYQLENKMPKHSIKNCAIFAFKVYEGEEGRILIDPFIENED
jgi:hypothetical protein